MVVSKTNGEHPNRQLPDRWPRPALTVDVAALVREAPLRVLLIQRAEPPFAGEWALPGGFVEEGETVTAAAARELVEETAIEAKGLSLLGVYSAPGRDPRGWTVSIAYVLELDSELAAQGGDDAAAARWFAVDELPPLAFDHAQIVSEAIAAVPSRVR
jgi:8-oxo-dGTP diphosphatase